MKQYPKLYEDIYHKSPRSIRPEKITSTFGSPEALANKFRLFYKEAHVQIFDMIVRQVWLEQQFIYGETRKEKRFSNGFTLDWAFSHFMRMQVGMTQKPITSNMAFTALSTYMKEMFPDFLKHDPFEEPEYFKYPFENVTIDHLIFVYQMLDTRMEMLRYAEEKSMSSTEFINWAVNHVFCYNDEAGEDVYTIISEGYMWPHIKDTRLTKRSWRNELFNFEQ